MYPRLRHEGVRRLATIRNISYCLKIPLRYLTRLSLNPDFPQAYLRQGASEDKVRADYMYDRQLVEQYIRDHVSEIPSDDTDGYARIQEFANGEQQKQGRKRRARAG